MRVISFFLEGWAIALNQLQVSGLHSITAPSRRRLITNSLTHPPLYFMQHRLHIAIYYILKR